jgi:hypothetical protein
MAAVQKGQAAGPIGKPLAAASVNVLGVYDPAAGVVSPLAANVFTPSGAALPNAAPGQANPAAAAPAKPAVATPAPSSSPAPLPVPDKGAPRR